MTYCLTRPTAEIGIGLTPLLLVGTVTSIVHSHSTIYALPHLQVGRFISSRHLTYITVRTRQYLRRCCFLLGLDGLLLLLFSSLGQFGSGVSLAGFLFLLVFRTKMKLELVTVMVSIEILVRPQIPCCRSLRCIHLHRDHSNLLDRNS